MESSCSNRVCFRLRVSIAWNSTDKFSPPAPIRVCLPSSSNDRAGKSTFYAVEPNFGTLSAVTGAGGFALEGVVCCPEPAPAVLPLS